MDFLQNASDDQLALMGCAVALLASGGLMCLSYYIGRGRQQSPQDAPSASLPLQSTNPSGERDQREKAA